MAQPPHPDPRRRPPRWARPALALVGLGLALGLAEGFARLRGPDGLGFMLLDAPGAGMESVLEPDPERLWRTRPGADVQVRGLEYSAEVRINALGLRGPELGPPDPQGMRVLALGDSFTLAAQVPEAQSYAALLGPALSEALGRRVEVLNGGVDGYGTQQATLTARAVLPRAPAQGLVLFFFLGNDFWENAHFAERKAAEGAGGEKKKKASGSALHGALARHSALYAWFSVSLAAWRGGGDPERAARYQQELSAYTDPAVLEAWAPATRTALVELRDLCRRRQLRCAVAAIPPAFVVHDERVASTFEVFGLDPEAADLARPARALAEAMPGDLQLIDLTEDLRAAAGQGRALYFIYDGHLQPEGHRVVAGAVADALAQRWGR
ncbi:MAG: hypothetical protein H6741_25060 [Alphaproteobacteria bacterium]|nr:hypothetical protein [Alphaproteobacteria bacterium]MCB9795979.1 hypothetical protein [Alphaproteobacteria bacterium]